MIIEAKNVTVSYPVGTARDIGIKEYLVRHMYRNRAPRLFTAVNDVTFSLERGDMMGIIGSNGAGKSTLLKVISGIMTPTKGTMEVNGSVAALLELSGGFEGDLTVRENTYLRGAMLGHSRRYMNKNYDEIISFAELRDFQDTPFRQLSTGMMARLAFSISSQVKPDVLILDEVLAVGDGNFQKKSEQKMLEIIEGGATTILVSHALDQVRRMCNRVLWLDHGKQIAFGETNNICDHYQEFLDQKYLDQTAQEKEKGGKSQL